MKIIVIFLVLATVSATKSRESSSEKTTSATSEGTTKSSAKNLDNSESYTVKLNCVMQINQSKIHFYHSTTQISLSLSLSLFAELHIHLGAPVFGTTTVLSFLVGCA
ncbi:uncharacterized protein LOC105665208 [Ceratitis capitata]|uniref:uncharacterized protein LOC105665208 n=1 Tax=Ceratitis capitata TaxID=7213 RepID=UPI000C6C500F|nr:uncharacterized protein LOC105665208 [Ceratitis capitata]